MQPTGIHLFGRRYWSAALSADVGSTDYRLLVKYQGICLVSSCGDRRAISWKPATSILPYLR
ncbi:hypothetical protein AB3479_31035 [Rhizobium mongolense]